jgi:hypothetical protein
MQGFIFSVFMEGGTSMNSQERRGTEIKNNPRCHF